MDGNLEMQDYINQLESVAINIAKENLRYRKIVKTRLRK